MSTGEQGGRDPKPIAPAKFWLKSALVIVVMGILLAWAWMPSRPEEPVYQGKPMTEWLELGMRRGRTLTGQTVCDLPIKQMGTNAIPALLKMLATRESEIESTMNDWMERLRINSFRFSRAQAQRELAAFGFQILGSKGESALPDLASMLHSGQSESQRLPVIRAISAVDLNPLAALPALLKIAETGGMFEQSEVEGIFGVMTSIPEISVPMLAEELSSPKKEARVASAQLLGRFKQAAQAAVPALLKALLDSEIEVREAAANTLNVIDLEAAAKAGIK